MPVHSCKKIFCFQLLIMILCLCRGFVEQKLDKNKYDQNYCVDCGLYGFCINTILPIRHINSYQQFNQYKNYSPKNECLKCICPDQLSGQCCEKGF